MVVAAGHLQLLMVRADLEADGLCGTEVKGRALHGQVAAGGDAKLVHGGEFIRVQAQCVPQDIACVVAVQVEIRVVREIEEGVSGGNAVVPDAELIILRKPEKHLNLCLAGESAFAVRRHVRELHTVRVRNDGLPRAE